MLLRLLRFLFGTSRPTKPPSVVSSPSAHDQPNSTAPPQIVPSQQIPGAEKRHLPPGSLAGLDTEKFAPAPVNIGSEALQSGGWRAAVLDSRHEIPSADLPRVQTIDRTMVGMGLISERELTEIHTIGQQSKMSAGSASGFDIQTEKTGLDKAGPKKSSRERDTESARESREDRQRRKAEKRAETERQQADHRERVIQRHATDIVFLGRGVSRGLADRHSDVEKLTAAGLPILGSPADVATAMGLTISKLRWLAFHSEAPTRVHYVSFDIPKKSGGTRRLSAPHQQLAAAQHWLLTNVLNLVSAHENAHGFVAQHSVATNAAPHVGSSVVINTDLKDFFPSITFVRVDGLLRGLGYSPAVATIFALLCTECPRQVLRLNDTVFHAATGPRALPQGACTSPAISNLIARKLDRRMSAMALQLGWRYTRYADDLTWSIVEEPSPSVGYVLARIRHIVDDESFQLNPAKTRVQRRSQQQSVTGVVVNDRLSVPRTTIRQVRAILHNAQRTGLAAQNTDQHPHLESWLAGMIGWIGMVNPEQGQKLQSQFDQIRIPRT